MPKKSGSKGGKAKSLKASPVEEENLKIEEDVFARLLREELQKEREAGRSQDTEVTLQEPKESKRLEATLCSPSSSIKNLQCNLEEVDRQSSHVGRVHLQNMERLQALQEKRLADLHQHWEGVVKQLRARLDSEKNEILSNAEQLRAKLEDTTLTVEHQHQAVMDEAHRIYSDITQSNECAYNDVRAKLNEGYEDMRRTNQLALYYSSKESKQLYEMRAKKLQFVQQVEAHMRRERRLRDLIINQRELTKSIVTESQMKEQDLVENRKQVNQKTRELHQRLTQTKAAVRKQLNSLIVHSDMAAKKLQAAISTGEKVLRAIETCRKHQIASTNGFSEAETTGPEMEEPKAAAPLYKEPQWCIHSVLVRTALRKCRDDLRKENQQLKRLLREHMDA